MTEDTNIFSASEILSEEEAEKCKTLLNGFIDIQLHLAPDTVKRACDDIEFARDATKAGYRGFIIKDHHAISAGRAYDLRRQFPHLAIYGGIVLNHYVGGFNPDAVEAAIKLGAKQVWMPTFSSKNHFKHFGVYGLPGLVPTKEVKKRNPSASSDESRGLSIFQRRDSVELKGDVQEIVAMVADANIILGTGHIALDEIFALLDYAKKVGVKKFVVTHPEFSATNWSVENQMKLAERGAVLEHCANQNFNAKLWATNIEKVGPEHCVLSSDSGQIKKGNPAIAMRKYIEDLMSEGVKERELEIMAKKNPAQLLDLD
jgi:hypothetical protein